MISAQRCPLNDQELERMADRVARMLNSNWAYVDFMIQCELHTSLSKREAITVARRALEKLEERQL